MEVSKINETIPTCANLERFFISYQLYYKTEYISTSSPTLNPTYKTKSIMVNIEELSNLTPVQMLLDCR